MMRVPSVFSRIVLMASVVALSVGLTNVVFGAASDSKPNIIFVFTDDMGYGDLGVLHQNQRTGKKHATPNLDRFAAEGIQLRRHYCPAPVCAPSRASLLRGLHQGHTEVRNSDFDKELPDNHTLGTIMQGAGYRTLHVGKYGLQGLGETKGSLNSPDEWPAYPTKRGFDEYLGYVRHVDGHVHYPNNDWPMGNSPTHQTGKEVWHNEEEISAG
ncbi:MAG: sulfatase-like hydrolase/transferase, partial [Opitutales bacterium]|nr:sulfatase-like hydrolase/transferase [Opitutales bacterium]